MGEPTVEMLRYQEQFSFFDFNKVGDSVNFISLAAKVEEADYCPVFYYILEQVRLYAPARCLSILSDPLCKWCTQRRNRCHCLVRAQSDPADERAAR
ncbi:hypothetical protein ACHAC9_03860 [Massilia sp. CMS3.1]|uniref:hypothetical protein n=1 Tax=Massilia sp. CMS3.1 TaxID=3373083 RepID=UPI003EE53D07